MSTYLPLISVVLLNQQQIEAIQEAIQYGRLTRSVAANSPKLAPPSLFSVDKTPNKKMGNGFFFVRKQISVCFVFFVWSSQIKLNALAIKWNSVLIEHLCHFQVVAEKQQSARK